MLFSNTFAGAFGLNIGDLSLKLVQLTTSSPLKTKGTFTVREIRTVPLPPGLIVNGEVEQPELVRRKLLQLLGLEGTLFSPIKTKWVVADLPEPRTFLKLITVDVPAAALTEADIVFQARKHLPFEMEEAYLDWQVVTSSPEERPTKVLIGAVPKIIADAYTYLLESADLTPLALEVEALAICRTLITRSKSYVGEARALLDLGATRSSLIIFDHDTIQFSTTIPFSGELLTTAIMQQLKVDYATAEKIKIKYGLGFAKEHPKYLKAVTEVAEILLDYIHRTLEFYKEHFSDPNPVTHITMCGGLATIANLDKLIASKLKIGAHSGNPWKNVFSAPPKGLDGPQGLSLVSAIGLAVRAAENPLSQSAL